MKNQLFCRKPGYINRLPPLARSRDNITISEKEVLRVLDNHLSQINIGAVVEGFLIMLTTIAQQPNAEPNVNVSVTTVNHVLTIFIYNTVCHLLE